MSARLEDICRRFTGRLHGRIRRMREAGVKPAETAWIGKLLIFYSLENCREFIDTPKRTPALCRFSMGVPTKEAIKKIKKIEKSIRGPNFLNKGVKKLSEYLVDFTFSNLKIEHVLGIEKMPEGRGSEQFELCLACESESSAVDVEVRKDFMKLIDVKAPVKIMIFQARDSDKQDAFMSEFGKVLCRHGRYDRDRNKEPEWLFIGNPGYAEWMREWEKPDVLPRQIHVLDTSKKEPSFEPRPNWWSWETGPDSDYEEDSQD